MTDPRVPLYDRLPEIYRIKDEAGLPPGQLRAFLGAMETAFSAVHENIEALYDDLFIDTCDEWVIPYLADLVGASHLAGEPRTLRADVADTIALRRRKGTLEAMERLAANLVGRPARAVEMRPRLGWTQHLNHQRPDAGGVPPYSETARTRFSPVRGGTLPVRDPAALSLVGTPFDDTAVTADLRPPAGTAPRVNLPTLALFLWRLEGYRLRLTRPLVVGVSDLGAQPPGSGRARFAVRVEVDALDRPVRLFNTWRRPETGLGARLTEADAVPGPIYAARLTSGSEAGAPEAYVGVDLFDAGAAGPEDVELTDAGLQLFLRRSQFDGVAWRFRGDNLCAWQQGLRRPLDRFEAVIDPDIGRILLGVDTVAERNALVAPGDGRSRLFLGYTRGAPGPVGAQPVTRDPAALRVVSEFAGQSLPAALANLHTAPGPVVVEIRDSLVHDLDPSTIPGSVTEQGLTSLSLAHPLVIRAQSGHAPVIRLATPLGFRPVDPSASAVARLDVRLEGLMLTRAGGFAPGGGALIARAAVARLELLGVTLDPGGWRRRDGARAPLLPAVRLTGSYGFEPADEDAFSPTPDIVISRAISGALEIDEGYALTVSDSIIDAGRGPGDDSSSDFAVGAATAPATNWGPRLTFSGATLLGRTRVAEASGTGGVFVHRLEVLDHQRGCIKLSCFSGDGDRLPPHHACVVATEARLVFTDHWFGDSGYCQLAGAADLRIATRGPDDNEMGAWGFLGAARKLANLNVRLREFTPVGVRPVLVPVT